MTSRVTFREILRNEVQDFLHQGFNELAALQAELMRLALSEDLQDRDRRVVEEMDRHLGQLNERLEEIRSRVLPAIG